MTNHAQIKSTLTLVLPLIAAFLAQKGMQFIDTYMMGWLGPDALAAGAIATGIFITILIFNMGTLSAVGVFIARSKGENNLTDLQTNLQHGIILALCLSIPSIMMAWIAPVFLRFIGQNPIVVANAALLLHGLLWGLPGYLLFLVFREFIAVFALTRTVMLVALGSMPLTFILNDILIYGKFGLPQLGIAGIGFAGAIVMWFMFLCLFLYCKRHHTLKHFITFNTMQFDWHKMIDMLQIGIPSGLLFILEAGMFLTAATLMGYFGIEALAAYQIAMQWASIAYSIPFALALATGLQVGHAMGEKNSDKAKQIIKFNLNIGIGFSIVVALIFIFFPHFLISVFLNAHDQHSDAVTLAISFLHIAVLFQCFDTIQGIVNGALRGLKDTLFPMIISAICYWLLGVNFAYLLSFHTELKESGIWYGITIGICSIGIILLMRLRNNMKKLNTVG